MAMHRTLGDRVVSPIEHSAFRPEAIKASAGDPVLFSHRRSLLGEVPSPYSEGVRVGAGVA